MGSVLTVGAYVPRRLPCLLDYCCQLNDGHLSPDTCSISYRLRVQFSIREHYWRSIHRGKKTERMRVSYLASARLGHDRECPPLSLPGPSTPPCGCWVKCSARPLLLSRIPGSTFSGRHQAATLWSSAPATHSSPALPTTERLCSPAVSSSASFSHGFIMQKRKRGVTGISKGTAAKCLFCRLGHSQGAGAVQKK